MTRGSHNAPTRMTVSRVVAAAGWGVVATLAMSVVMIAGTTIGVSPMPKPIPAALVGHALGALPKPGLLGLALAAHLGYGAAAAAALAGVARRVSVAGGLAYGTALWALAGLVWLPYLGWGVFGTSLTPAIAAATLLLHLIYGATLGLLLDRRRTTPTPRASPA